MDTAPAPGPSLAQWERDNNVTTIATSAAMDEQFGYDEAAQKSFRELKPWKQDPHYFKYIKISAVALLKMLIHAQSGGNLEVS